MLVAVPWQTLVEAWQAGYDYALERVNEHADDLTHAPAKPRPAVPHERRVADRLATFEAHAAAGHERRGTREWLGLEHGEQVMPW